jgi:hypothetical protein
VKRDGVAVRPLRPVVRIDDFHLVWPSTDATPAARAFAALAAEAELPSA